MAACDINDGRGAEGHRARIGKFEFQHEAHGSPFQVRNSIPPLAQFAPDPALADAVAFRSFRRAR